MSYAESISRVIGVPVKLAFCGLDFAGKTAMVMRWKTGQFKNDLQPTLSCTLEVISIEGGLISATVFDMGGQLKLRDQWKEYLIKSDAVIFVLDANDPKRYSESKDEFHKRIIPILKDRPCVVVANKLDLVFEEKNQPNISELILEIEKNVKEELNIPLEKGRLGQFDVIATSMLNGLGLKKVAQFLRLKLAST